MGGVPFAQTESCTVWPLKTVVLAGWPQICGGTGMSSTARETTVLVAARVVAGLLTIKLYDPASVVAGLASVNTLEVAPEMGVPFFIHWYCKEQRLWPLATPVSDVAAPTKLVVF